MRGLSPATRSDDGRLVSQQPVHIVIGPHLSRLMRLFWQAGVLAVKGQGALLTRSRPRVQRVWGSRAAWEGKREGEVDV